MSRQGKTRTVACALAALGLLMTAGDAMAQSDGVFVDPDTPAGKEYALPLDKARQDVAPSSGAQGSESGDTEPFGAGISKRDGGGGGGDAAGSGDRGGNGKEAGASQSDSAIDPRSVAKAAASSGSGISSGWLTVLIAAGVLLVGGIAGVSLRALRAT
jgi:hypothetical protein